MSVKIIAGRAKTGKSSYIYDEIKKEASENSKCNLILIVPELMTYQAECDIIEKYNLAGIMNVEILSFNRLESKILSEVGGLKVQNINVFGKIMLLKQIFEENKDKLQVFGNSYKRSGFLKEFDELITEFKQNLISSDSLIEASNNLEDELLKKKILDIELIYSKFNEKNEFFDEEDKTDLFISLIKESNYLRNSKIWIDGFESFNWQRLNLIKNLYDNSKSLSISLNINSLYLENLEENDDWEAFKMTYDTYVSLNRVLKGDVEIISINGNKIYTEEIKAAEKNIFSLNVESFKKDTDKIVIYSSLNPYSETQKTAAKIISLVRDKGCRWKDIKVAAGNMDSYEVNIKRVFTQYKIPYFLDIKRDIMNNPLTKYILAILDMFIWRFKHDYVFGYLKTGLSPLKLSQVNCLENYALQYGIEGEKWFREFKLYNELNNDDNGRDVNNEFEIEEYRKIFADDFINERKVIDKLKTTSDITRFVFNFLEKHNVYEKIQEIILEFNNNKQYEEASEYSQVWNHVMEIFEQLLLVGEETEITAKDYRKMLESGLSEIKVSIIPPAIDKVEIGDIDRIAVNKSKVLFILGANDSNLDAKNTEKGLLLNDERDLLLENNVRLIKGADYDTYKDRHMLYKLFSCPTERLNISYALGKTSGESLQPSMYVDVLKKIFISVKEESDLSSANQLKLISNYSGTYDYFVENMRNYIDGYDINDIWKDVYTWYEEKDKENFTIIDKAFKYNNFMKQLETDNIQKIYRDNMTMTVSKLENYARCQFKYFVENVLKPKPRIIQKIEFYDLGNIYHSVVEKFVDKLGDNYDDFSNISKIEAENIAEEITGNVLIEQSDKVTALEANFRNKYMKKKINRVMKRTAWTIVRQLQGSEFRPKYTELQIDFVDKHDEKARKGIYLNPIEIPVSTDKIKDVMKLRGKIDRVDAFEYMDKIYVNIIDYKSSPNNIDMNDVAEGLQMQLIMYLKVLIDNGGELFGKKPDIGGVFYYYVNDPIYYDDYKEKNIDDEIFKQLKLRGYVLRNKNIVKFMDKNIGSTSDVIPAAFKSDGNFYESRTKALAEDEFNNLIDFVYNKSMEMTKSILEGNIDINPYKKYDGSTPCQYCEYLSVCQFDKSLGNNYHLIRKINEDEIIKTAKGGSQ